MTARILTAFAAILIAVSALAQETAPARFFIERIEVRNTRRISSKLVKSELLLREGQEYSEEELRAASDRLGRLPFLLTAEFALEKGSDRGRYVLAISVTEAKPFFYLFDIRPTLWDESRRRSMIDEHFLFDPGTESKDAGFGFRWFIGGRGVLYVGYVSHADRQIFTRDFTAAAVGYTQYGLFGTAAFATINLRLPIDRFSTQTISPQLVVGVPITKNQTLTLDVDDRRFNDDTFSFFGTEIKRDDSERMVTLAWTYNTTNQPFVPTRGTVVRVAPLYSMQDRTSFAFTAGPDFSTVTPISTHLKGFGVDLLAMRYWELSERHSVSAGVIAGWASVDDRYDSGFYRPPRVLYEPAYEILRAGYSRNLWRDASRAGDSRIETDLMFVARQRNVEEGGSVFGSLPNEEKSIQGAVSWVRRSSWGTLRLGVGYAWQR